MEATTGDDFPAQGYFDERFQLAHLLPQCIRLSNSAFAGTIVSR
jgi:hypothetical protein